MSERVRDGERWDGLTDYDDDEGCVVRFRDAMGAYDVRCETRRLTVCFDLWRNL